MEYRSKKDQYGNYVPKAVQSKNAFSEKFSIPKVSTAEEIKKAKAQELCEHPKWRKICSCCGKVISSEVFDELSDLPINEIMI